MRSSRTPASETVTGTPEAAAITAWLEERINGYLPGSDAAAADLRLVHVRERSRSRLYRYEVTASGGRHSLLVKVAVDREAAGTDETQAGDGAEVRPRLAALTDSATRHRLEYEGLLAVQRHFPKLAGQRHTTVAVHDFIPRYAGIVMDHVELPTLRQLVALPTASRVRRLGPAVENAGAWLRTFHALPAEDAEPLRGGPGAIVEIVAACAAFLGERLDDGAYFRRLAEVVETRAGDVLEDPLPLALGHGDFAMRNVFVAPDDRVAAFDMCAKWRAPIYEDIAYFLISLRTAGPQVLTQGLFIGRRALEELEERFLVGYFSPHGPPRDTIRLFEIVVLLDRWCAEVARRRSWKARLRSRLVDRMFRRTLDDLVSGLREGVRDAPGRYSQPHS